MMAKTDLTLQEIASNPNTSPDKLQQLATSNDCKIRQLVAANPNAPTKVLWRLGAEFPEELLANPIFPLWFLENPDFINDIPMPTLCSFSYLGTVPDYLEPYLKQINYGFRRIVAQNLDTPANLLSRLAEDEDKNIRFIVAKHQNTPISVLTRLAKDSDAGVRFIIAQNSNSPVHLLSQLATDEDEFVRWAIACNLNAPASILAQLAEDEDGYVRDAIAKHLNTPAYILNRLGSKAA